jgi:glycosyltransferase involved in cell wall biosynthesis
VEEDCGFVVPYIDVAAMAAKVVALAESPELRARLGAAASRKVRERHDISVAGPQLLAVIDGLRRG